MQDADILHVRGRAAVMTAAAAPADVSAVSVHGTGTPLGDPIEVGALGQGLRRSAGELSGSVLLLSNKACFGHTEGTAGLSGVPLNPLQPWLCTNESIVGVLSRTFASRAHSSKFAFSAVRLSRASEMFILTPAKLDFPEACATSQQSNRN